MFYSVPLKPLENPLKPFHYVFHSLAIAIVIVFTVPLTPQPLTLLHIVFLIISLDFITFW